MKKFNIYKTVEHAGLTVEEYLKQVLKISGRKIQKLTRQKGILLNGRTVYLQKKLKATDTLRVLAFEDTDYGVLPEPGIVEVLYEDDYLFVLNKPAFQLVHPTGQTTSGTLANYLANHLKQRGVVNTIRPVHRLDRDTSGCVIFAKDGGSQNLLEQQLKKGTLKRTYVALVNGAVEPASGVIDAPIGPHPSLQNRRAINDKGDPAITHYRTLQSFASNTLLELTLETGRTHQIRIHLAHLGHPIIGDGMYGVASPLISRQALHASSIGFRDLKNDQEIVIEAPLTPDIAEAIGKCMSK